jgi:nucleoside 2-deoxyribosyltransferase
MARVYIGSSLLNANQVKEVIAQFKSVGIDITYDWTSHGKVTHEDDLKIYGMEEYRGVVECDLFFMIHPARNGTHVEMGIALACNKPIVMVLMDGIEHKTFYYLANVHRFKDLDDAFNFSVRMLK